MNIFHTAAMQGGGRNKVNYALFLGAHSLPDDQKQFTDEVRWWLKRAGRSGNVEIIKMLEKMNISIEAE